MKTKKYILNLALVLIVVLSLVAFFSVISEDDDFSLDRLSNDAGFLSYRDFVPNVNSAAELTLENQPEIIYSQPLISYLARYEKSPPFYS